MDGDDWSLLVIIVMFICSITCLHPNFFNSLHLGLIHRDAVLECPILHIYLHYFTYTNDVEDAVSVCVREKGGVVDDWVINGLAMSSRPAATGHRKDPVPLVEKSRASVSGDRFPPSFLRQDVNHHHRTEEVMNVGSCAGNCLRCRQGVKPPLSQSLTVYERK